MLLSAFVLVLQTPAAPPAAPAKAPAPLKVIAEADAVTIQAGELPIIISAPHGGHARLADFPERTGKDVPKLPNGSGFSTAYDTYTDRLALATADEIEKRLGKRPYVVVMNLSRRQVDANRPESIGVETEGPRRVYRRYHAALAEDRSAILARWGKGLLIDIHGQGSTKDAIYRGTGNGNSMGDMMRLVGPDGLITAIEKAGIRFIPAVAQTEKKESAGLSGGWITRHYGAREQSEDGKDRPTSSPFEAVQFETGIEVRRPSAIPHSSEVFADALVAYARRWLGVK